MASGHEQALAMAGLGKGKVNKSIKPPRGFGVVDHVFHRFNERWRDEFKRSVRSQEGCEALAGEWQRSLIRFGESDIRAAVVISLGNTLPPTLPSFIGMVEQVIKNRQPVKRDKAKGREWLNRIKAGDLSGAHHE